MTDQQRHCEYYEKLKAIHDRIVEYFGLKPDDLKSHSHKKDIVLPRYLYFKIACAAHFDPKEIAGMIGYDRTTVYHGNETAENEIATSPRYCEAFKKITKEFGCNV